jgi:dihydroorotate dehydrogenase (fumarate)/dihydroorotate dehydrogenase
VNLFHNVVRPTLFRLDAETAHRLTIRSCQLASRMPALPDWIGRRFQFHDASLEREVAGMSFQNPIGLAAGWDKSGQAVEFLDRIGFGFAEIGSISARPSVGNPKPRLFRLPREKAIVVNYGLPNDGAEVVAKRLSRCQTKIPLGINVVNTNDGASSGKMPEDEVYSDYACSLQYLHKHADYVTLNLSCPNTDGDQDFFSHPGRIGELLLRLNDLAITCPVFLKLSPDSEANTIDRILAEVDRYDFVAGFLFNLPGGKPSTVKLESPPEAYEKLPGAVAGKPIADLMNNCIGEMYRRMDRSRFTIIGGGGVFTAQDAYEKIRLGASLIQIYSAMIYDGPSVVKRINQGLVELLKRDGLSCVSEAVGTAHLNSAG